MEVPITYKKIGRMAGNVLQEQFTSYFRMVPEWGGGNEKGTIVQQRVLLWKKEQF